ncbi:MAG TPA: hypothetical protein VGN00_18090 [Puia sp.]|jgi:hypothetical protein
MGKKTGGAGDVRGEAAFEGMVYVQVVIRLGVVVVYRCLWHLAGPTMGRPYGGLREVVGRPRKNPCHGDRGQGFFLTFASILNSTKVYGRAT